MDFQSLQPSQYLKELEINRTMQTLTLDDCELNDCLICVLADALKINRSITKLDLRKNNCKFEGALSLGLMLKQNKAIEELNLSFNPLGSLGIMVIVASIMQNKGKHISAYLYGAKYVQIFA